MRMPSIRVPLLLRLFWQALGSWQADKVPRLGAALAYYTLFTIAPVLIVVIAIAGAVFGQEAVRGEISTQLDNLIGGEGARAVEGMLEAASRPRESRLATILGSVTLVIAATGAFLELQAALNTIWRVKPDPKPGINFREFFTRRLRSFGLVVSIGFLLMVSLAVSAGLAAAARWLSARAPGLPTLLLVVNTIVSVAVITALFAVLYRVLPDVRLRWRDVAVGALATAVLFTIGKQLIGLYLGRSSTVSMYGAAGSLVVLLVWVYYSAQIVLLGAEFTRVYTERDRGKPKPENFARRDPTAPRTATRGTSG
jgi:membrane protein